jgi:hypothetical protein
LFESELSISERPVHAVEGPSKRVKIGCKVGATSSPIEGPAPGIAGGGMFGVPLADGTPNAGFRGNDKGATRAGVEVSLHRFRETMLLPLVCFRLVPLPFTEDCWPPTTLITFDVVSLRAIRKAGGS